MTAFSIVLVLHIVFGSVAILSGVIALCLAKGQPLHQRFGAVFVICMIVMAVSGVMLALLRLNYFFLIVGVFTLYLTCTGWYAIRRPAKTIGALDVAGMTIAIGTGAASGVISIWSLQNDQMVSEMPAPLFLGYAFYGAVFATLDALKIKKGGYIGASRIADHVWRMIMALIFAVTALFVANPRIFPDVLQTPVFQWSPVTLLFVVLCYWIIRIKRQSWDVPQAK